MGEFLVRLVEHGVCMVGSIALITDFSSVLYHGSFSIILLVQNISSSV